MEGFMRGIDSPSYAKSSALAHATSSKKLRLGASELDSEQGADGASTLVAAAALSDAASAAALSDAASAAAAAAEATSAELALKAAARKSEEECDAAFFAFETACAAFDAAQEASVAALQRRGVAQARLDEVSGMGEEHGGWTEITKEEEDATAEFRAACAAPEIKVFNDACTAKEKATSVFSAKLAAEMMVRPHVKCLARFSSSTAPFSSYLASALISAVDALLAKSIYVEAEASSAYHALVSSFVI